MNRRETSRLSHPAALTPAAEEPYQIPSAPAPPSIPPPAAYDPSVHSPTLPQEPRRASVALSSTSNPIRSPSILSAAGRSMINRIGSLRSPIGNRRHSFRPVAGRYGILEDTEEPDRQHADDRDETPQNVYDLTTFDGPLGVGTAPRATPGSADLGTLDESQEHNVLATEYHQLEEANGRLTGGLGKGVTGATLLRARTVRGAGEKEAKERNEIVAIREVEPGFDMSSFDPNDDSLAESGLARNGTGFSSYGAQAQNKSYYFPPDPEKPDWKPFTMRWPWISFLIVLSLGMAGVQEYLFHVSDQRTKQPSPGGLLQFKHPKDVSYLSYFAWKYMPTMIAVTYGVLWQIVDFEVKRLEPYYQLSSKSGALASESLNMDYLNILSYFTPFKAMRYRQWAVLNSASAALLAAGAVPILQTASINMAKDPPMENGESWKYVRLHPVWSRVLTGMLIFIALLGCHLLYQLRRKSGLLSNPKGIAGIAAMANKSHILMDFTGLDLKQHRAIHERLKHRRYILHKSTIWQGEYITKSNEKAERQRKENPHPLMLRLPVGISFISSMLFLVLFFPIMMFTSANKISEGKQWLLTAIGTIIKIIWTAFECDVRMMEPFFVLSRRHASSDTLTLDYTGTIPGWLPVKALLNGHFLVAAVGVGSIMTEVFTVCVTSFSVHGKAFVPTGEAGADGPKPEKHARYDSEETFKSFWVSFSLAMGILLCLCSIAGTVYWRRRHPVLPREPSTIASILTYIHQSKMLWDFVDTETYDTAKMRKHLRTKGKRYGMGWFKGRDGEDHCGIDEEELMEDYKPGVAFFESKLNPGRDHWEHY
ncbi:MAG: hypothetical protein M1817_005816 [Caeruleum heppii]|nr:MAG: hypothetical protein M1817_005816 [Caeruleum heppii]